MRPLIPEKETLPHLIRRALAQPRAEVLRERVDDAWTPTSSAQLLDRIENVACAIRAAGLERGDRVALIAHDCVDWIVADFATLIAGCVVVPIYPTQALDHTGYILEHSGAKLLFIDTPSTHARLKDGLQGLPTTIIFATDGEGSLAEFEIGGAAIRNGNSDLPAMYETQIEPDDLAVLIYTSGTTGNPKGVMLSHDNLAFDAQATLSYALEDVQPDDDVLSVLPFSHIYEHTFIYLYLLARVRYNICHDANDLLRDLTEVEPCAMTSVPRIFDRVLAGVTGKAMQHGGLQAKLVPWALHAGRDYMYAKVFRSHANPWQTLQYAIAKRLVLDRVRRALGLSRLRYFSSGSAALHIDAQMTYLGLGVHILQGYGLTETSPVITCNRLSRNAYGTVGQPLPGVEVRIAGDGEILTCGRHVMQGYFSDPAATAATIVDGWLHTGDIGELDADGFLIITDRKKEVFKTSTGKFVSPARVESAIKRSVFVTQAMVVGDGRAHPAALICPNWDLVRIELGIAPEVTVAELAQREDVLTFITREVRRVTDDLASYEQIRRIIVVSREFSVESGELSPSMKIKRRVVEERYRTQIDRAYDVDLKVHAHA